MLASPPAACGVACVGKRQIFLISFTKAEQAAEGSLRITQSLRGAFGHSFSDTRFSLISPRTLVKRGEAGAAAGDGSVGGPAGFFQFPRTYRERGEEGLGTVPSHALPWRGQERPRHGGLSRHGSRPRHGAGPRGRRCRHEVQRPTAGESGTTGRGAAGLSQKTAGFFAELPRPPLAPVSSSVRTDGGGSGSRGKRGSSRSTVR